MLKISCYLFFTLVISSCLANNELENIREKRSNSGIVNALQSILSPVLKPFAAFCKAKVGGRTTKKLGNGRSYYISPATDTLTWPAARDMCKAMGGHLLTVDTTLENSLIVAELGGVEHWIGLNDIANEGIYLYTYQTKAPSLTFWDTAGGFPLGTPAGFDCVLYSAAGLWQDVDCTAAAKAYICEFEFPCSQFVA